MSKSFPLRIKRQRSIVPLSYRTFYTFVGGSKGKYVHNGELPISKESWHTSFNIKIYLTLSIF